MKHQKFRERVGDELTKGVGGHLIWVKSRLFRQRIHFVEQVQSR